jgi:hypothetical protein
MSSISLVISPQGVEYVGGRLDPDMDSRLNAYRLVHEQQSRAGNVRWFFFAQADLSKPEALSRAQQWYASNRHPDWPGIAQIA